MKTINEFKVSGVLGPQTPKETSAGKKYTESFIMQSRTYNGTTTTNKFPFSAWNDAEGELAKIPQGAEVTLTGYIRTNTWQKDPTRVFINLNASKIERNAKSELPNEAPSAFGGEDTESIPF